MPCPLDRGTGGRPFWGFWTGVGYGVVLSLCRIPSSFIPPPTHTFRLCASGEVSQSQLSRGLRRVADNLNDLCLDNPTAKEQFDDVVKEMRASGLLEDELMASPSGPFGSLLLGDVSGPGSVASSSGGAAAAAAAGGHSVSAFKVKGLTCAP